MLKRTVLLAVLLLIGLGTAVSAQEPNRAALIIRLADGQTVSHCVEFTEAEISGAELLNRSGLGIEMGGSGMGASVCSIEGQGCPANDCFCQCKGGGECLYWSYWLRQETQWQYSQAGASSHLVQDGDVQGWSWGIGTPNKAIEPPLLTFDQVCGAVSVSTTAVPVPAATAQDTPQAWQRTQREWLGYALLAVIVVGLGGLLVIKRQ